MAYLQETDPRRRAAAIAGVGLVHLALAAALVTGLTVSGAFEPRERILGIDIRTPPPPPAPPPPAPRTTEAVRPERTDVFLAPKPLPTSSSVTIDMVPDGTDSLEPRAGQDGDTRLIIPTPTPSAAPSFAPRGAVPRGRPGAWISTDDYPARALRAEQEGTAGYRLVVSSAGRVSACEITRSSGSADLDRETCRLLAKRAQFDPATDQSGLAVVGTYSGSVKWEIPD